MSLSPFLARRFKALSAVAAGEPLAELSIPGELKRVTNVSQGRNFRAQAGKREQQRVYKSRGEFIADELALRGLYDEHGPLVVVLVRVAPQAMDGDNLEAAFKRVRDGIAEAIGINDRDGAVEYVVDQQRGEPREKAIRCRIYRQIARPADELRAPRKRKARPTEGVRHATIGGRLVAVTPNVTRAR